jgi:SPP1 gp7 family putative phage head morphogenesis protein
MAFGEDNPDDLVQKVGLRAYEKMLIEPTVQAGSRMIALGVVGPGDEIVPAASGERAAEEMAEMVTWTLDAITGAFKNVELGILTGRTFGFSNSELKWGIIDEGEWAGKWGLIDIKTKPPFSYGFKRDDYGNLLAITHKNWASKIEEFTNLKKWVMYTHNAGQVFGNSYGRSQLRPAYDYWKALRLVFRMRGVFVERTASGIPLIRYKRGLRRGEAARYEKMVRKIQTAAGMAVPDDVTLEWAEKKGDSHEEFEKFAVYCERAILRSMLIPSQVGIGPETTVGSMAKAQVHQQILDWVMDDMDSDLTAVVNDQIIKRICDNNFPNAAQIGYPTWRHKERSSEDAIELVAAYVKAAAEQSFGPVGREDVNLARRRLGHPELTKKEWAEYEAAQKEQEKKATEKQHDDEANGGGEDGSENTKVKDPTEAKQAIANITTDGAGEDDKVKELAAAGSPFLFARQQPFVRETLFRATVAGMHENVHAYRELTAPEKAQGLQPKKYAKTIDQINGAAEAEVAAAMRLARDKILPKLGRRGLLDGSAKKADLWEFGGMDGGAKKQLTSAMHRALMTGYVNGALTSKAELERGTGKDFEFEIFNGVPIKEFATIETEFLVDPNEARKFWSSLIPLPADVAQAYKAESFWITGLYLDDHGEMLRQIKEIIRQGYTHENWATVEARINGLFDEWVGADRVTQTGNLFQPWHTETIVRNAVMRSYNAGRAEVFRKGKQWITSYQWASLIDERTTDFCDGMDRVIFVPGQIEFPPAHHQCRSIVVAILRGMTYKLTEQTELARLMGMRDPAFTTGIMGVL